MSSHDKWFLMLYLAWGGLLLVTSLAQRTSNGRRSCLLGALGFGLLGVNLALGGLPHVLLTVVALGILLFAGLLSFRVVNDREH